MTVACISAKLWSYQPHESCSMTHAPYSYLKYLYIGSKVPIFWLSSFSEFQPLYIWVILFELGEFWWISKNGENGFESDDLWFQQLRLSCHFLTNWFELFWFIMLKDTRHPTYTSCDMIHLSNLKPAFSVYATNINHLIYENFEFMKKYHFWSKNIRK